MLGIHPKTLRQWLKQDPLELSVHPRDARIKCLTSQQVEQLAVAHDRSFPCSVDLRGADLRGIDLRCLPLARLYAGPTMDERDQINDIPRNVISVLMERTDLRKAHLEGAYLCYAHLNDASLSNAYLESANLQGAQLEHTRCRGTDFRYAIFRWATLKEAHLRRANLEGADLSNAYLEGVRFMQANLSDTKQMGPRVVDAHWDGVNLAVVEWSKVVMLGDEYIARQKDPIRMAQDKDSQFAQFEMAVRANRQLAVALQAQGLNEIAARFAYRAQMLQRIVLRCQKKFGPVSLLPIS